MSAASTTFYYDGDCGMCVAFVRRVARLDRKGRVEWIPYQSLGEPPAGEPVGASLMGARCDGGEPLAGEPVGASLVGARCDGGEPPAGEPVGASLVGARAKSPSPSTGEGWDGGDTPPLGVTLADMARAAYTVSPDGVVSEGFYAIRALLKAIPALAPLGLFMSIPGVSLIGRPVYRLVANNRRRISQSCRIQPKDTI